MMVLFSITARGDLDAEDDRRASARMRELVATVAGDGGMIGLWSSPA
jgi:hypothetical protein